MKKPWMAIVLLAAVLPAAGPGDARAEGSPRTPRAGEAFTTQLWGEPVEVAPRDRTSLTDLYLGLYAIPHGPEEIGLAPFGSLFVWRNLENGRRRIRAVVSGFYNDLRVTTAPAGLGGAELVFTFENLTIPFARSEYVEGVRVSAEELQWHRLAGGIGLGYRRPLEPGHQDNALEAALTYEPGLLLFRRGDEALPTFQEPRDTYEGRLHLRVRVDRLERNLLELPHQGIAGGLDGWQGHRARWRDWGGPVFGPQNGAAYRTWLAISGFVAAAGGLPWVASERHRWLAELYGGVGRALDRFSSFRLDGGPTSADWEALSRPVLPGAAFGELFTEKYLLVALEYRYELLFFTYLHLRGTFAWLDRPLLKSGGTMVTRFDDVDAVTVAATTGFFWESQLELGYTRAFGLSLERAGRPVDGRDAFLLTWAREF